MKRLLITFFNFIIFTFSTYAAPAYPFPITVSQPDGTQLTILLHGDEYFNWTTTTDNVLLAAKGNAWYIADITESGDLTATALLAHNVQQRTAGELAHIQQQTARRALFNQQADTQIQAARRAPSISTTASYFPHKGSPRVLIILAEYPDSSFVIADPVKSFNQYFNGEGVPENYGNNEDRNYCSVKEYFKIVSKGQYTPQFDVVGPVMLPNNMAYYGGSSSTGSDEKLTDLCRDACNLVKNSVDFTNYDNDGDGKAELVYILHAGTGQNTGGGAPTMWAKCGGIYITVNGVTIIRGGCHSELFKGSTINGIGPFIHEFSHGMGLPDLYVTTSGEVRTALNQSMQAWDVMDYGLYNYNLGLYPGYAPAAYTAWEQEVMGWIEIPALDGEQQDIIATPLIEGGTAYKIQNPDKPNEYIVMENIQQTGINNGAYGHGLLVYHIDYNSSTVNMSDNPNNTLNHPRVAVIPSGGLSFSTALIGSTYTMDDWKACHAATPFPGAQSIGTLTDTQGLPNYLFYTSNGTTPVGHALYNITEDNGIVNFCYDTETTGVGHTEITEITERDVAWYTLDGRCISVSSDTSASSVLPKGVYIHNGKKVVIK